MSVVSSQQKIKKHKFWRRMMRLLFALLLVWGWEMALIVMFINTYGWADRAQPADVIIVLGAGLEADNTPSTPLIRRSLHAANLWRERLAPVIVCTGGKPGRRTRAEADACVEVLHSNGIPDDAILQEDQSRSTEENAINVKAMMEVNGWRSAILVSDGYHLFRANYIFARQGILVYPSRVIEGQPAPIEHILLMARELLALHWQVIKEIFNLPITYVQSI